MTRIATSTLAAFLILALAAPAYPAEEKPGLVYSGTLRDENGAPLAGVFPLAFALHRTEKGRKKVWTETHWVAVDEGQYSVALGVDRKVPARLELTSLFLGVSLVGGGELVRERLSERNIPGFVPGGVAAPEETWTTPHTAPAVGGGAVGYADRARVAAEAEQAFNSERIGNLTLEELDRRYKTRSGARIGAARRVTELTGGEGGRPFELKCPKGYVAVGIRGASARLVDSLQVICAPLE